MKILIPILTVILVICGCSKQKPDITTPENATVILLCSSVLQTNDQVQIFHRVDEIIAGTLDPKFLNEAQILKGLYFPTIENMNVPQKYFILGRPKASSWETDQFRIQYQWTGIPVYDETILEHKNDISFLQEELNRQMELRGDIKFPSEEEMKRIIEEHEKSRTSG